MSLAETPSQRQSKGRPSADSSIYVFPQQSGADIASRPGVDIVFVHGIGKTWQQTWGGRDASSTWLRFIQDDFLAVRIMTYGFSVIESLYSDAAALDTECKKLLARLRDHWTSDSIQRSVIFVAHSLGGLIIQKALLSFPPQILDATAGVIFLGTPQFSNKEDWITFGINIAKSFGERRLLTPSKADILFDINHEFGSWSTRNRTWAEKRVCCVSEELPVYRVGLIVPQSSARLQSVDCMTLSLHADHFSMSRCRSSFEPRYQRIAHVLKAMTSRVMQAMPMELSDVSSHYDPPKEQEKQSLRIDGRDSLRECWTRGSVPMRLVSQALGLEDQGCYQAALRTYNEALEQCTRETDEKHAISLFCRDKKALMLMHECKYEEAEQLSRETCKERASTRGKIHPLTLLSAASHARILRYRGRFSEAYDLLRDSLASMPECPFNTVHGMAIVSVLAKVLKDQGIFGVSELLSRDVVRASKSHLGSDHPFTLNRLSDLGAVLSKRKQFIPAEQMTTQALEGLVQSLGPLHPLTLRTTKRLGKNLRFQGRFQEALPLLRTTVECQRTLYGNVHPDTISTRCSLAVVYALLDRLDEAETLLESALTDRKTLFTENHPDVQWTSCMLEATKTMQRTLPADRENGSEEYMNARAIFMKPSSPSAEAIAASNSEFHHPPLNPNYLYREDAPSPQSLGTDAKDIDSDTRGRRLRLAAANGKVDIVRQLLDDETNINAEGGYYGHALQAAAFAGSYETTELLLGWSKGSKADVNALGGLFGSALRAAALGGDEKVVQLLLDKGADPSLEHHVLGSALEAALIGRHELVVRALIESMPTVALEQTHPLISFVQKMISEGNFEAVKLLLTAMANAKHDNGDENEQNSLNLQTTVTRQAALQLLLSKHAKIHPGEVASALQLTVDADQIDALAMLFRARTANIDGDITDADVLAATVAGQQVVAKLIHEQLDKSSKAQEPLSIMGQDTTVQEDVSQAQPVVDVGAKEVKIEKETRFDTTAAPTLGVQGVGSATHSKQRKSWSGRSNRDNRSIKALVQSKWRSLTMKL